MIQSILLSSSFEDLHGQQLCVFAYVCTQTCNLPFENSSSRIFQNETKEKNSACMALIQKCI